MKSSMNRYFKLAPLAVAMACIGGQAVGQILPSFGSVVGGSATIGAATALGNGGQALGISQSSNRAIINWNSFSIGALDQVNIVQQIANAVLLNRVTGSSASLIQGQLNSRLASTNAVNGSVYLINPNGVTFANGATVNTGGLLASTMDIDGPDMTTRNAAFMNTGTVPTGARLELTFSGTSPNSIVVENGASITATPAASTGTGGAITLLGASVRNAGVIEADRGSVNLASAANVTLVVDPVGDGLTTIRINDPSTIGALVENTSIITADGGRIALSGASTAAETVVRQVGTLRAQTIDNRQGVVVLDGSAGSAGNVVDLTSGSIDASGTSGAGGTVNITAQKLMMNGGSINADGTQGGTVSAYADVALGMSSSTVISAKGTAGNGGSISVGASTALSANPIPVSGAAAIAGTLNAHGSVNGGTITTSAGSLQVVRGTTVIDAGGTTGSNGIWTINTPRNSYVTASASSFDPSYTANTYSSDTAVTAIADSVISNALSLGTNVVLNGGTASATGATAPYGVQVAGSQISKTGGPAASLTVNSSGNLFFGSTATIQSAVGAGALNVAMNANAGTLQAAGSIYSEGGNVNLFAKNGANTTSALIATGTIDSRAGRSNTGSGGNVTLTGVQTYSTLGSPGLFLNGATVISSSGNISLIGGNSLGVGAAINVGSTLSATTGTVDIAGSTGGTAPGLAIGSSNVISGANVNLRAGNNGPSDAISIDSTITGSNSINLRPVSIDSNGVVSERSDMPITVGSAVATTGFDISADELSKLVTPGTLIIGSGAQAADITVTGAINRSSALTLANDAGGNIAINAPVTVTTLGLISNGNITQGSNAPIVATSLRARALFGDVTLQNAANSVSNLNGGSQFGTFLFTNAGALSISPVTTLSYDTINKVASPVGASNFQTRTATIRTLTGNLTLNTNLAATNSIDLVAAGTFQNPSGKTINASPWRIWAATWLGETRGGLVGSGANPDVYNCTYMGACNSAVLAADNHFVYTASAPPVVTPPVVTPPVTPTNPNPPVTTSPAPVTYLAKLPVAQAMQAGSTFDQPSFRTPCVGSASGGLGGTQNWSDNRGNAGSAGCTN